MYQTDMQSNIATAEDRGVNKGIVMGRTEGRTERSIEIARNLLKMNLPFEQIVSATGLTFKEVEELCNAN
jgi:predicted transposase/invertase (TIGR01784 family)